MKEITLEQYKDFVIKSLTSAGYYTEFNNQDNSIVFSLTNRVNGLEGVYAVITEDELEHQHEYLNEEDIDYISEKLQVKE